MAGKLKGKRKPNRYQQIVEHIFFSHYKEGDLEVDFSREEFVSVAAELGLKLPKNLGDITYAFRYRIPLPDSIMAKAPQGQIWIIRPKGRSRYRLVLVLDIPIVPDKMLAETKVPDSTPGVVKMHSLDDEQALLARVRYNRLVDIFTGITSYSLQNHLRTFVRDMGQVETDELYVGIDKRGAHYIFPVQAKGGKDKQSIVQIEQDFALCAEKFPNLIYYGIGAQFMANGVIAMFGFEMSEKGIVKAAEKHYRLVAPNELTVEELRSYRQRLENS